MLPQRWREAFKIVTNANTVIGRIDAIEFDDADTINRLLTKARFRAWATDSVLKKDGDEEYGL